jgi:hypothetical protein
MMQSEVLPVTQEDRDAAADLIQWHNERTAEWKTQGGADLRYFALDMPEATRRGVWDTHDVVQFAASIRLATEARLAAARQPAMDDEVERVIAELHRQAQEQNGSCMRHDGDEAGDCAAPSVNYEGNIEVDKLIAAIRLSSDGVEG